MRTTPFAGLFVQYIFVGFVCNADNSTRVQEAPECAISCFFFTCKVDKSLFCCCTLYSVLTACTYIRPEPLFLAGFKIITAQASRHAFTRKLHSSSFLVKAWREAWVVMSHNIPCYLSPGTEEPEFVSFPSSVGF